MAETTKPVLTRAQKYAATIELLTKRIAGHGTFLGEWLSRSNIAQQELDLLKAKHQPSKASADGISPKQHEDFAAALHESAGQTARRELGHGFNMAYEG